MLQSAVAATGCVLGGPQSRRLFVNLVCYGRVQQNGSGLRQFFSYSEQGLPNCGCDLGDANNGLPAARVGTRGLCSPRRSACCTHCGMLGNCILVLVVWFWSMWWHLFFPGTNALCSQLCCVWPFLDSQFLWLHKGLWVLHAIVGGFNSSLAEDGSFAICTGLSLPTKFGSLGCSLKNARPVQWCMCGRWSNCPWFRRCLILNVVEGPGSMGTLGCGCHPLRPTLSTTLDLFM